jgi:hypothetical protein
VIIGVAAFVLFAVVIANANSGGESPRSPAPAQGPPIGYRQGFDDTALAPDWNLQQIAYANNAPTFRDACANLWARQSRAMYPDSYQEGWVRGCADNMAKRLN